MKNFNHFKHIFAIVLMLAMLLALPACGTSPASDSNGPAKIKFEMFSFGETPDEAIVEEALNNITRDKIGVEVDIEFYNLANYEEQIGLKMAGNEAMDLVAILGDTGAMARQGELMPIDDLLEKFGKDIMDVCGDLLYYATIDGKNYGVPFMANKKYVATLICRKDILDECGIDPKSMTTLDGVGKAYEIVHQKYPEMTMLAPDGDGLIFGYYGIDNEHVKHVSYLSGDAYYLVSVNDDPTVINFYESESYKRELDTMRAWYEAGYILKDAATTSEVGSLSYYDGSLFSYISNQNCYGDVVEPIVHAGLSNITFPSYAIPLSADVVTSADTLGVGISSNSKNPEAAMKWLNLLFTDSDMATTLYYGVKDHHWQMRDDGLIEYCDGIEAGNSGWEAAFNWCIGNSGASYVFNSVSNDPDHNKKQLALNNSAEISITYGFEFDPDPVETQIAAVSNVVEKYAYALESGSVDVDTVLPQFIAEMKAAGVDDVVAEAQSQLDTYMASK